MMDLVNELEDTGDWVRVEEAYCGMLIFPDDMAMVPESEEEIGRMLDKVDAYSRKWRLKLNEKNIIHQPPLTIPSSCNEVAQTLVC